MIWNSSVKWMNMSNKSLSVGQATAGSVGWKSARGRAGASSPTKALCSSHVQSEVQLMKRAAAARGRRTGGQNRRTGTRGQILCISYFSYLPEFECTVTAAGQGHKIKTPISDREISLFTDEQSIRDLFLKFPQGVYKNKRTHG